MAFWDKVHYLKKQSWFFLQSIQEIDIKNIVGCWKEFFAYFNALETHSDL